MPAQIRDRAVTSADTADALRFEVKALRRQVRDLQRQVESPSWDRRALPVDRQALRSEMNAGLALVAAIHFFGCVLTIVVLASILR